MTDIIKDFKQEMSGEVVAHSFIDEKEHIPNEEMTDSLTVEWGFKKELEKIKKEMRQLKYRKLEAKN